MPTAEHARYWRHPGLPGMDLLRARFVRHTFTRHVHDTYTVALIESGVEEYSYRGQLHRVGPGDLGLVDAWEPHTGQAGIPEGWSYRVLYPSRELIGEVAAEAGITGTFSYRDSRVVDPEAASLVRMAHQAAEGGDSLAASSLTRIALDLLVRRHARAAIRRPEAALPSARAAVLAADLLGERLLDPPALEELAATAQVSPFALLRAFRNTYGLPPHAWLNQQRVHRARTLLSQGDTPAEVAARVGFADQSHLTRHFKRHVGVPPGAFRRGVFRPDAGAQ
ncbi:helix-turn-helix transcriptional regulator [Nocardiopsis ansamitocini]|uniref:Transcriptional regulator n=1 Tax=Nocardiopsis ansamitocini TaxID=1670832 RepID=A0A9W6P2I6_9ACTN|nr:AraC family transcriptional regulator [Nocardiopsis ansamitocini]GLU45956.1 transcriptional regulator [Nocardiopsis ansamitocini]